jgi:hypothetical protein
MIGVRIYFICMNMYLAAALVCIQNSLASVIGCVVMAVWCATCGIIDAGKEND